MIFKQIKCVIVDFDKTLYSDANLAAANEFYMGFLVEKKIVKKSKKNIEKILKTYPQWHMEQCVYKIARENGFNDEEIRNWCDTNVYDIMSDQIRFVKPKLMKKLCETLPVYMLSDSSQGYLNHYLKVFKYKREWFRDCLSNQFKTENMSKTSDMLNIVNIEKLQKDEVVMIGDSLRSDIKAANEAGILSLHVKDVAETEQIFKEIIKAKEGL